MRTNIGQNAFFWGGGGEGFFFVFCFLFYFLGGDFVSVLSVFENKIIYSSKNIGLQFKTPREAIEGLSLYMCMCVCVCVCEFEFWILTLSRVYTKYLVCFQLIWVWEHKLGFETILI